jgi:hypothetical protein
LRRWLPDLVALRALAALACLALAGCHLAGNGGGVMPSPLDYAQQEAAILDIVPKGTPKEQVAADLKQAGISGSFGVRDSIYYCDAWRKPRGETWHLDVALLFDEEGKLYASRPASAKTSIDTPPPKTASASASANVPSANDFEPEAEAWETDEDTEASEPSPFGEAGNPFAAQEQ